MILSDCEISDSSKEAASEIGHLFAGLSTRMDCLSSIVRIDVPTTIHLEHFQRRQNEQIESLGKRAELAAFASPTFRWWQVTGTWPREDGGWTMLLIKATFETKAFKHPAQRNAGRAAFG